jgi:hypothetical protein
MLEQPQSHPPILFNAKTPRRKDAKATRPPSYRRGTEAQRRRGANTSFLCIARSRQPALFERRPRYLSSLSDSWEPAHHNVRQNRRASGTSVGERRGEDGCSRPEATLFSPATGDRTIAWCSAVNLRHHRRISATAALRLCVSAPLRSFGRLGALRVVVSSWLRRRWAGGSVFSVSLWFSRYFGGSKPLPLPA